MMTETTMSTRRVHFLPQKNRLYEIESHRDYTKQELRDYWVTEATLQKVVKKRSEAALEWEADKSCGLYMRGLEQYTDEGESRVNRTIKRRLDAVMDEQDLQWEKEEDDYDRLAAVSQQISRFSVGLALLRAEEDEAEARRIYQSMETPKIKRQKNTSGISKKEPTIVLDDATSVCSDLSLPPQMDSLHSRDSYDTAIWESEELEQAGEFPSTIVSNNKRTSESLSPNRTRAKFEAMRSKIMEISDVLHTIQT